jgi:sugar lactone lactonase YvrE
MKVDKNEKSNSMYGFKIGQVVELKTAVEDERGNEISAGQKIRLVAFTPKVFYTSPSRVDNITADSRECFFNAVVDGSVDAWDRDSRGSLLQVPYAPRIRAHFCTIKKIKERS